MYYKRGPQNRINCFLLENNPVSLHAAPLAGAKHISCSALLLERCLTLWFNQPTPLRACFYSRGSIERLQTFYCICVNIYTPEVLLHLHFCTDAHIKQCLAAVEFLSFKGTKTEIVFLRQHSDCQNCFFCFFLLMGHLLAFSRAFQPHLTVFISKLR